MFLGCDDLNIAQYLKCTHTIDLLRNILAILPLVPCAIIPIDGNLGSGQEIEEVPAELHSIRRRNCKGL